MRTLSICLLILLLGDQAHATTVVKHVSISGDGVRETRPVRFPSTLDGAIAQCGGLRYPPILLETYLWREGKRITLDIASDEIRKQQLESGDIVTIRQRKIGPFGIVSLVELATSKSANAFVENFAAVAKKDVVPLYREVQLGLSRERLEAAEKRGEGGDGKNLRNSIEAELQHLRKVGLGENHPKIVGLKRKLARVDAKHRD